MSQNTEKHLYRIPLWGAFPFPILMSSSCWATVRKNPRSCFPGSLKALPPDRVDPHITCLIPQKYAKHADQSPFSLGW